MMKKLTLSKTRDYKDEDAEKDKEFLLSCLVQLSIEKSRDDLYGTYSKYWKDKFENLDMDDITTLIKLDFQHVEETAKDRVKAILVEKKWRK